MPNFRYKGRGRRGDLMEGVLEANSRDAVASRLLNSGITPVDINEVTTQFDPMLELKKHLTERQPDLDDLILFSRQMFTLLKAGVPINQALNGLIRSSRNAVLAARLGDIKVVIESGQELSSALSKHPGIFSNLFVNTVRIGENTGRLDAAFEQLAIYLDRERDTRARIKAALRYPSFVIAAISVAIGILNVVVIPQFAKIFERAQVKLPLPTKILIGMSNLFVDFWPLMIAAVIAVAFAVRRWVATDRGRFQWDKWKLSIPIVGDLIYRATLGRFARGFSMSLAAGVPMMQALGVMAQAVDNEFIGERIRNIRTGVERGDTLTRSATATGMFSPLILQMLAVGEESGAVDELLGECAAFYEREVDYDVKNLSQTIEPLLIVVLAAFVALFALGIFLPMWDLATVKLGGAH